MADRCEAQLVIRFRWWVKPSLAVAKFFAHLRCKPLALAFFRIAQIRPVKVTFPRRRVGA
jgi:hypothetical protein